MDLCYHKRFISKVALFGLVIALIFTAFGSVLAAKAVQYEREAEILQELGLFQGTNTGFELDRKPTRAEGAAMLVRLLGKEDVAEKKKYAHPFIDVPNWADSYIGYMYAQGLTSGISDVIFGSTAELNVQQYLTFVLRALGYDDSKGDFRWDHSIDKAVEIGLLTEQEGQALTDSTFLRDHVAYISHQALSIHLKHTDTTLLDKLIEDRVDLDSKDQKDDIELIEHNIHGTINGLGDNVFSHGDFYVQAYVFEPNYNVYAKSYIYDDGTFYFNLPPGEYLLNLSRDNYNIEPYLNVITTESFQVKDEAAAVNIDLSYYKIDFEVIDPDDILPTDYAIELVHGKGMSLLNFSEYQFTIYLSTGDYSIRLLFEHNEAEQSYTSIYRFDEPIYIKASKDGDQRIILVLE